MRTSIKGFVKPRVSIELYSVIGPYIETKPYLRFGGEVNGEAWEWGLYGGLDANLGFVIEIMHRDLADFYTTLANWETEIAVDQGEFQNNPPELPTTPFPADNAINIPITTNLSWSCSDSDNDSMIYDIYFGTLQNPPLVLQNSNSPMFDPGGLEYEKTYFWKVVAKDDHEHLTQGPIWSFTTIQENNGEFDPGEERVFDLGYTGVQITMVWIPPGSFIMGAWAEEPEPWEYELPRHQVNLDYGFWLGKYEVTQPQWEAVMDSNPSYFIGERQPVEYVNWNDVHEFLDQLNALEEHPLWRIPSESEWEYALRAGTTTRFHWGDDSDFSELGDYAWYYTNSDRQAHDVGLKLPNPWGLYDMHGNVWEWCEDWWHDNYEGAPNDGSAWDSPSSEYRVKRGGSYNTTDLFIRGSSGRGGYPPFAMDIYDGFRLVRER